MAEQGGYEIHEAALIMPPLPDKEFSALVESIRRIGQQEEIKLYGGKILDGAHRYRACLIVGVNPKVKTLTDEDVKGRPKAYVFDVNGKRRQLTTNQLAIIGREVEKEEAELAKVRMQEGGKLAGKNRPAQGRAKKPEGRKGRARDIAAEKVGVNGRTIDSIKRIEKHPELLDMVKRDEVPCRLAERLSSLDKETVKRLVADGAEAVRAYANEDKRTPRTLTTKDENGCRTKSKDVEPSIALLKQRFREAEMAMASLNSSAKALVPPTADSRATKRTLIVHLDKTRLALGISKETFLELWKRAAATS